MLGFLFCHHIFFKIVTPLLTLIITSLIMRLVNTKYSFEISTDLPFILNIPAINNIYPMYFNVTCLEWYMIGFDNKTT
jgi:hypothetical protein